jgi:hypothetical protein
LSAIYVLIHGSGDVDGAGIWSSPSCAGVADALYERQGRVDRAVRAVRRCWIPIAEPEPAGFARSYRLEGRLAALADDKAGAIRAYRNYLKMRVDPEPSRVPQLDSVRAPPHHRGGRPLTGRWV